MSWFGWFFFSLPLHWPPLLYASPLCSPQTLTGSWTYSGYIYKDQVFPPNNPDLFLQFDFSESGISRLYWKRKNQNFFCERYGRFIYRDCQLIDEVTWVNPDNGPSCQNDPDMRVGHRSISRLETPGDHLHLYLRLGDDKLIYIWNRLDNHEFKSPPVPLPDVQAP